jgi:hypothetical protein
MILLVVLWAMASGSGAEVWFVLNHLQLIEFVQRHDVDCLTCRTPNTFPRHVVRDTNFFGATFTDKDHGAATSHITSFGVLTT